jgi:hypothetical protein
MAHCKQRGRKVMSGAIRRNGSRGAPNGKNLRLQPEVTNALAALSFTYGETQKRIAEWAISKLYLEVRPDLGPVGKALVPTQVLAQLASPPVAAIGDGSGREAIPRRKSSTGGAKG